MSSDGLRTKKTVDGVLHEYEYSGGRLYYEKYGDYQYFFRYNALGNLATIKRRSISGNTEKSLYVICNSRGDVEELRNTDGTLYARYVYDSWGNTIKILGSDGKTAIDIENNTNNIAVQNPLRYRGYYWDSETGLYYLQSRYYDPVTCRFVNADEVAVALAYPDSLTDKNLYAYCDNNPIARIDNCGNFWGTITGAVIGAISGGINAAIKKDNIWAGIGIGALSGAISGFAVDLSIATGGLVGVAIAAVGGAASSVADDMLNNYVNKRPQKAGEIICNAAVGAAANVLSFGMCLDDTVKTGAKTVKQVFQNMKDNFVRSAIGNGSGKIPKRVNSKKINLARNVASEAFSASALNAAFKYLGKSMQYVFGGCL